MTTNVQTNRTDHTVQTALQLQLAHVVIDCDAQAKVESRYHSVHTAAPLSKSTSHPSLWPTLAACTLLLTLATALSHML